MYLYLQQAKDMRREFFILFAYIAAGKNKRVHVEEKVDSLVRDHYFFDPKVLQLCGINSSVVLIWFFRHTEKYKTSPEIYPRFLHNFESAIIVKVYLWNQSLVLKLYYECHQLILICIRCFLCFTTDSHIS